VQYLQFLQVNPFELYLAERKVGEFPLARAAAVSDLLTAAVSVSDITAVSLDRAAHAQ
jgi:hypothetical protein